MVREVVPENLDNLVCLLVANCDIQKPVALRQRVNERADEPPPFAEVG